MCLCMCTDTYRNTLPRMEKAGASAHDSYLLRSYLPSPGTFDATCDALKSRANK